MYTRPVAEESHGGTAVHVKWHQTLLFLFQTALFVADTTTNILTSLEYREQGHRQWFAVSLGLTIITLVALCIWYAMVNRSRLLSREKNSVGLDHPDIISRNNRVDIEKERLYNLYVHTLIFGLLQAASQLVIQYYVYLMLKEGDDVIPKVSMWISLITLDVDGHIYGGVSFSHQPETHAPARARSHNLS